MLMDNQNQTEISPNPQTTNGQTLAAETTNLQPSTVNINNSDNKIKITSVGDVGFKSFDSTVASSISIPSLVKPINHHYQVFIFGGLIILACIVATGYMSKSSKASQLRGLS